MNTLGAIIALLAGIIGIAGFFTAAFKSSMDRQALWIASICCFLIGLVFVFSVGTDVGILCSVIVMQIAAVILALLRIAPKP